RSRRQDPIHSISLIDEGGSSILLSILELAANILREYSVRNSKNYFVTDSGSRYGVPAKNVIGLFILEQVVLDTAFSANARNKYAAELLQLLRGHKESNKIRLKLGLITLIHYPILRKDLDL
ncbi:unnamed protein product, partial [Oikopleura dioica]